MPNTRAKFKCNSVTKQEGWGGAKFVYNAKFFVVTGWNSEENKQFFASTPTGTIEIGTVRDDFFEPGQEYYVDFTKVEKPIDESVKAGSGGVSGISDMGQSH